MRDVDVRGGSGGVALRFGRGGERVRVEVGSVDDDKELYFCRVDVGGDVGEDGL